MPVTNKNNDSLAPYSNEELLKCLRYLYDNVDAYKGKIFCPRVACIVENNTFLDGPLSEGYNSMSTYYSKLESSISSIGIHYFEIGNPDEVNVKRIIENNNHKLRKYTGRKYIDFITIPVEQFVSVLNDDGRHDLYYAYEKLLARKAAKEAEKKEKLLSESTTSTSSNALENTALVNPVL